MNRISQTSAIFLVFFSITAFASARVEALHGRFSNGLAYSGEYSTTEARNADGMRVNPLTIKVKIDGETDPRLYKYIAEGIPTVQAGSMGVLVIIVSSGGMEGSVTYNYVIPNHGQLVSLGTVQTSLHLGKVENIDVQPNKQLARSKINESIVRIFRFNAAASSDPINAYSAAIMLLLGKGRFLTSEDHKNLSTLYANKEIQDDTVLLRAIEDIQSANSHLDTSKQREVEWSD
jgi:hypothetical protein